VKPSDLLALKNTKQARTLVQASVEFTKNYFRRGFPLLEAVQGRFRLELRATYLGGQGILSKIRSLDYNVLEKRPAWSSLDKASLALRALLGLIQP
jgi:phytoene/squalene synthetase